MEANLMSVVLMYHGIFPDSDSSAIDAEDLPYAVSVSNFTHQLDLLAGRNVGLYSAGKIPDVVITFDDGHASSLYLAAPMLVERNLSAYFFVTSNFIGQRKNFLSGDELFELSRLPGLCIGSHGMTHRFFDDMSLDESKNELIKSRQMLEHVCGSACRSISFPGGRYHPHTIDQLVNAGYTQWFGSHIGLIDPNRLNAGADVGDSGGAAIGCESARPGASQSPLVPVQKVLLDRWSLLSQNDSEPLERVAIRYNTQMPEFRRIVSQEPAYFRYKRLSSQVKRIARRVVGNRLYHGLYKSIAIR